MNQKETAQKYKKQSIHYFENALNSIGAGDAEKAGEFLWGSMAEAIKAVAASEGKKLRAHREIADYARELAKNMSDEAIWDVYGSASYLHSNYYEGGLGMEEIQTYAERIRGTVKKLLELVPDEA
jgi:hypothetical protein